MAAAAAVAAGGLEVARRLARDAHADRHLGPEGERRAAAGLDAVARRAGRRSSCRRRGSRVPRRRRPPAPPASRCRPPGTRARAPAARRPARPRPAPRRPSTPSGPHAHAEAAERGGEVRSHGLRVLPDTGKWSADRRRRRVAPRRIVHAGPGYPSLTPDVPRSQEDGRDPPNARCRADRPAAARRSRARRPPTIRPSSTGRASCPALSNAGYEPSSGDECRSGRLSCMDTMIRADEPAVRPARRALRPRRDLLARLPPHHGGAPPGGHGDRASSRIRASSRTRARSSPTSTSTPTTPGTRGDRDGDAARLGDRLRRGRRPQRVRRRRPPARDERPHPARPPVRARRHRHGQAGRHVAQARPRQGQRLPQPRRRHDDPGAWRAASTRPIDDTNLPDHDRRHAAVPDDPGLARDRVAQRRAARRRADDAERAPRSRPTSRPTPPRRPARSGA